MATISRLLTTPGGGGGRRQSITNVALDSSYPTGGEAVTAANLGLTSVAGAVCQASGGYMAEYDITNSKLKMYYADYDATGDGPLIEVPNATSLATVTVTIIAWGRG